MCVLAGGHCFGSCFVEFNQEFFSMKTKVVHSYSDNSITINETSDQFQTHPGNSSPPPQYATLNVNGLADPKTLEEGQNDKSSNAGEECCLRLRQRGKDTFRRVFQKKNLEKTFPIISWAPQYNLHKLVSDFIAGATVGLTILPQGLAYATVAGLPPIYGLYSGFVGPLVYILFGSTKVITIGPNAIQCILTYKFINGKPPEYAVFLCFTSGIISLAMAFLRLGFITNFISYPVISAFTSAISLTIVATQVKALVGINFDDEGFVPTMKGLFANITKIHKWDSILSLICCISIIVLMKLQWIFKCCTKNSPKWDKFLWIVATSRNAIIITSCTILAASLNSETQSFSLVGDLVPGLPEFKPPPFTIHNNNTNTTYGFLDLLREEATAIAIMPLLGLMGHITIAKAFAGSTRVDGTQEVLSIGISNLISSFFSSMPIAGSFSRTTVNAFSGAEAPLGGLVTGVMVIFALQFLTPYFYYIPKSSLASVVILSVIYMVDFTILRPMWRSKSMTFKVKSEYDINHLKVRVPKNRAFLKWIMKLTLEADLLPWSLTFITTLFVGVDYGILTGLAMSAIFLLYYAARPRIKVLKGVTTKDSEFILVELDRSLTYPSVDHVTDNILKSAQRWGDNTAPIVVDCHHIQFVDFTAAKALCDMVQDLNKTNYKTIFWKVKPSVLRVMEGIMHNLHKPFVHCRTEYEMEALVDASKVKMYPDAPSPEVL